MMALYFIVSLLGVVFTTTVMAGDCLLIATVTDRSDNQPLIGVKARIVELAAGVAATERLTDRDGEVSFSTLKTGADYRLTTDFPGAISQTTDVRCLDGGSRIAVALEFFEHVSLIRLIATPGLYDGKYVAADGFLRLEFEGDALYLSAADRKHYLSTNAVWIEATENMRKNSRSLCRGPVSIVGRFDATSHGHMGLFGGELKDIRECTRTNP